MIQYFDHFLRTFAEAYAAYVDKFGKDANDANLVVAEIPAVEYWAARHASGNRRSNMLTGICVDYTLSDKTQRRMTRLEINAMVCEDVSLIP